MTAPEPPAPTGPLMIAPFRELIHNIHQFGQSGEHWSWRCGVSYSTVDPGWVDGACRYDHVCGRWDELVQQGTAHLEKWHGIVPAAAVPDTGQAREPEHIVTQHWDAAGGDVLYRTCSCGEEWNRDEYRCPEDGGRHDGLSCEEIEKRFDELEEDWNDTRMWLARRGVTVPGSKRPRLLDMVKAALAEPSGDTASAAPCPQHPPIAGHGDELITVPGVDCPTCH